MCFCDNAKIVISGPNFPWLHIPIPIIHYFTHLIQHCMHISSVHTLGPSVTWAKFDIFIIQLFLLELSISVMLAWPTISSRKATRSHSVSLFPLTPCNGKSCWLTLPLPSLTTAQPSLLPLPLQRLRHLSCLLLSRSLSNGFLIDSPPFLTFISSFCSTQSDLSFFFFFVIKSNVYFK